MKRVWYSPVFVCLAAVALASPAAAQTRWPTLQKQLQDSRVIAGSALDKLIRANQDFRSLRAEEAKDQLPIPLWLRAYWRKAHPEGIYSASDPTGGYPLVLKEVHEWMIHHQNLQAPPESLAAGALDSAFEAAATGGANVRMSGAQTSPRSESDIRINFNAPSQVIAASNNISAAGRQAMFRSTDGGATWSQSLLPLTGNDAFHSDPTVDWTSDGVAWSTTIGINNAGNRLQMRSYRSTDGGATWTFDATFSGSQRSADKQQMWIDHSASSAFRNNIYTCWHNGTPGYVNRRTTAWGTPLQVTGAESTGTAIGCDIKTNSAGDVFVFWPTTGNRKLLVAKSTNGGVSYGTPVQIALTKDSFDIGIPSFAGRRALIYASGGAYRSGSTNQVFLAWTDLSGNTGCTTAANEPGTNAASTCKTRIWFSRSTDGGATWSAPVKVNDQASNNDQFNQALAVDETNGKVGIMYYDTVADATRKKTHVYYQSSADGGLTWSSPLQVSTAQTDETVAGADSGNQYGDYNSLSGFLQTFLPSWTDRRAGAREEIWTAPISDP